MPPFLPYRSSLSSCRNNHSGGIYIRPCLENRHSQTMLRTPSFLNALLPQPFHAFIYLGLNTHTITNKVSYQNYATHGRSPQPGRSRSVTRTSLSHPERPVSVLPSSSYQYPATNAASQPTDTARISPPSRGPAQSLKRPEQLASGLPQRNTVRCLRCWPCCP